MKGNYGYAVADHLEGPYTLSDHPVTDNVSYLEDAQAFQWKNNYYLLTTDNLGGATPGGMVISAFGNQKLGWSLNWQMPRLPWAISSIIGEQQRNNEDCWYARVFNRARSGKLERPAALILNGKPADFYSAADLNVNGGKEAESYVFKIDRDGGI